MENLTIVASTPGGPYHVIATAVDGTRMVVAAYTTEKAAAVLLRRLQEGAVSEPRLPLSPAWGVCPAAANYNPPSSKVVWPVIYADASEAR